MSVLTNLHSHYKPPHRHHSFNFFIPHKVAMSSVVGRPIHVPQRDNPYVLAAVDQPLTLL